MKNDNKEKRTSDSQRLATGSRSGVEADLCYVTDCLLTASDWLLTCMGGRQD